MDRMIYLAMSAAKQTMTAQALATHNLSHLFEICCLSFGIYRRLVLPSVPTNLTANHVPGQMGNQDQGEAASSEPLYRQKMRGPPINRP